jgi:hypothetical protein
MSDTSSERALALSQTTALYAGRYTGGWKADKQFLGTATALYGWLTGPVALTITLGPAVDQATGRITGTLGGDTLKDSEKAQLNANAVDAKGQPTTAPTSLAYTSADESVATIVTDADGTWVVAGSPGSTVVTGDWPDSPSGDIQGTVAVDVTAGDAVSLSITLGAPVPQ